MAVMTSPALLPKAWVKLLMEAVMLGKHREGREALWGAASLLSPEALSRLQQGRVRSRARIGGGDSRVGAGQSLQNPSA